MATAVYLQKTDSPLGPIWAAATDRALLRVLLPGTEETPEQMERGIARSSDPTSFLAGGQILARFAEELAAYFQGNLLAFRTPAEPQGTPFQQRVWKVLTRIPYGRTRSYGWVAWRAGVPGGARAVGQANARNPVPLIVPCHRVVAADGSLGGFSSGLQIKRFLLDLERRAAEAVRAAEERKGSAHDA